MSASMILVRWTGPYTFDEARKRKGSGLYVCWGRNRLGKTPSALKLLYCGISEDKRGIGQRIYAHKGEDYDHKSNDWWVGRVALPSRSTRAELEAAEWMVVRFTGTEHNEKKALTEPPHHCYLVSEWFTKDGGARANQKGASRAIHDVIGWDPSEDHLRSAPSLRFR